MLQTEHSKQEAPPVGVLSPHEERIERGEALGLIGEAAQTRRALIHRLLEGFRDQPVRLNVERARLLTESMRASEGQPTVLRWGKALAHILLHHPVHIEEGELLVGSAGPPGRYAVVYCELVGPGRFYTHPEEVVPSQEGDAIVVTEEDVAVLQNEILPYWEEHQYHAALMNALPDDTRMLLDVLRAVEIFQDILFEPWKNKIIDHNAGEAENQECSKKLGDCRAFGSQYSILARLVFYDISMWSQIADIARSPRATKQSHSTDASESAAIQSLRRIGSTILRRRQTSRSGAAGSWEIASPSARNTRY
jgi:hypothetical protein